MHSRHYLFGLALLTILLLSDSAYACSCGGGGTPCQALGTSSAVFVGTVTGSRNTAPPRPRNREELEALRRAKTDWTPSMTFKFSVELAFLGVDGTEVEVGTGSGSSDCGYEFVPGKRYLVYANRFAQDNRLATNTCSRTRPYEEADEDIKFLGTLPSISRGVTIYGEITRRLHNVKSGDSKAVGSVPDASLVVEGVDERREIRSDAHGRYRVSGLRPGKYKVTLALPEELTTYRLEQEVTIADRGCAAVDYYVADNGRIGGRVFDADGQPVAKVLMTLADADNHDPERFYSKLERTDQEGRYVFTAVPPGRYLIALNLTRFPEPNDPTHSFPRTYYPGVAQASQASIINLGAGEKLTERDLQLSQRRPASVIKGIVMWADGTPVANAGILFSDVTYHNSRPNYSVVELAIKGVSINAVQADQAGRFTMNAYEGQTFVIEARSDRTYVPNARNEPMERAEFATITIANPVEHVKIVITKLR